MLYLSIIWNRLCADGYKQQKSCQKVKCLKWGYLCYGIWQRKYLLSIYLSVCLKVRRFLLWTDLNLLYKRWIIKFIIFRSQAPELQAEGWRRPMFVFRNFGNLFDIRSKQLFVLNNFFLIGAVSISMTGGTLDPSWKEWKRALWSLTRVRRSGL